MQMIKSFFGLVILAAIAALVYVGLNNSQMLPETPDVLKEWQKPFESKTSKELADGSSNAPPQVTVLDPADPRPPEVELDAVPASEAAPSESFLSEAASTPNTELIPVRRPEGPLAPPAALMESPEEEDGSTESRLHPPGNSRPEELAFSDAEVVQASAAGPLPAGSFPQAVDRLLREGKLSEALLDLTRLRYGPGARIEGSERIDALLNQLAGSVIYSEQSYLEPPYAIQPGDTWENLAGRFGTTPIFLARINHLNQDQPLSVGQSIKVVRGPFDGIIFLEKRELVLTVNGRYAGRFAIAVGDDASGVSGSFIVQSKTRTPTYHDGNRAYSPGDPGNPLGDCLINLDRGIGLHGTSSPQDLARDGGPGWFRLSNQDINDLYAILSVGSRIVIQP